MTGSTGVLGPGPVRPATPFIRKIAGRMLVLTFGYIPKGIKSPERVMPQADVSWDESIKNLEAAIALCRERSRIGEPWLTHPMIGFCDAGTWERFHIVHARHHFGCLRLPR
jgi:hypothetical protein